MSKILTHTLFLIILTIALIGFIPSAQAQTISNNLAELPRTGNQPQITSQLPLSVTELPRTGIPAIAWAVAALTPVGAKLLHGRRNKYSTKSISANSLWTDKQLKKDL